MDDKTSRTQEAPMKKKKILAICPNCGTEYPERNYQEEKTYTCTRCGLEGYDCCVPGNFAVCTECEGEE
jgi:predicted RNA-binding Zn-ribbon protein involved in translation (DUF1610 family)